MGEPRAVTLAKELSRFPADARIQGVKNLSGLDDESFSTLLSAALYANLRTTLTSKEFDVFRRCFEAAHAGSLLSSTWIAFLDRVRHFSPQPTALALAEVVCEVAGGPLAPQAVLSFNAEPLFGALVNGLLVEDFRRKNPNAPASDGPKTSLDRLTRSISSQTAGRIPYVFCHGLLPVAGSVARGVGRTSTDKLVFSEGEYLGLSGNMYSWQANSFMRAAASNVVLFVGVSLTDANMRRWLAVIHANRALELKEVTGSSPASTCHWWLELRGGDRHYNEHIEAMVAHLGVRLVWLDSWAEAGPAVRRLLGL